MTTLIIDIKNSDDARKITDALRQMKGITRITVEEDKKIADIHRAEEDIAAGRVYTAEEVRAKYPLQ